MKKAISSVIALVLILIIAIVASVSVFVWVLSIQEDMTHHSHSVQERFLRTAKSSIEVLSDTFFNSTLYVELINTGTTTIPLEEARIYLVLEDEGLQSICNSGNLAEGGNFQATVVKSHLAPGETLNLAIAVNTDNCNILPYRNYKYTLVFPDGISVSGYFRLSTQDPDFHIGDPGEPEDPEDPEEPPETYPEGEIWYLEDLDNIRNNLSRNYSLMRNLDFQNNNHYRNISNKALWTEGEGWDPIGEYILGNPNIAFTGTFKGHGHQISDLFINKGSTNHIGLFGVTYSSESEISNLGLININVIGNNSVGGLVGTNRLGVINTSYSTGEVNGMGSEIGGLVGYNYDTIANSYSTAEVIGNENIGGIAGITLYKITNSYSTGNVLGDSIVGGFVGFCWQGSVISNSYSTGSVTRASGTSNYIGGFVGVNWRGNITNSYSIGSVHYNGATDPTDKGFAGNFVNGQGYMSNNFWDTETSDQSSTAGNATGKTSAEMENINTFLNASWDIAYSDTDLNNGYPFLAWQDDDSSAIWLITEPEVPETYPEGEIWYLEDLDNIRNNLAGDYKLMKSLDFKNDNHYLNISNKALWTEGEGWIPIGQNSPYFSGSFDGQNYTISNLYINRSDPSYVGFFGRSNGGNISNTGLISVAVYNSGGGTTGSLLGLSDDSPFNPESGITINNVWATGIVEGTGNEVGGLLGLASFTTKIYNSYADVSVSSSGDNVGGFIGLFNWRGNDIVENSYSLGDVSGSDYVGGFVGRYMGFADSFGVINKSYSIGEVNGTGSNIGGFSGGGYPSEQVINSFWDIETSGQATSHGGTGKNTSEMKDINTFLNAGWDIAYGIVDINDGYPFLGWQDDNEEYTWLITEP